MGHITIVGSSMGIVEARLNSMLKEDSSDSQSEGNFPGGGLVIISHLFS